MALDLDEVTAISSRDSASLPAGWRTVRFDQMAQNVSDRVDNPSEARVERYVGLEHLDPESLKIRRWGSPSDVEATKLRFKPGDIIFGRRRAYQRKLAVADFEGICSAHAMVLRAREDVARKEFLPFFMQSDLFFNRALQISVGSLSPTINWTTLARQEFAIPPLDEQRHIADILWEADTLARRVEDSIPRIIAYRSALFDHLLQADTLNPTVRFSDVMTASPASGYSAISVARDTGHYVLALSALSTTGYQCGHLKPVELAPEVEATRLSRGDFLISRSNTLELVGLVGIFTEDRHDVSFPDTMMRLQLDESLVDKKYVEQYLLSRSGRSQIRTIAAGTSASMKKINRKGLASISLPLPSLETQRAIIAHLDKCGQSLASAHDYRATTRQLRAALVERLISGGLYQ